MDSIRACSPASRCSVSKTFQKVIQLKPATRNANHLSPGSCLIFPHEKFRCCESAEFEKECMEEEADEAKRKLAMEALIAKIFATVSAVKAAYAELQLAQFPYDNEAIQAADQTVVDELKTLSELKYRFLTKQIDCSPPELTLLLAETQEQKSLMKTYEITMKKMQGEIEAKKSEISSLQKQLREITQDKILLEDKLSGSVSFSVLDNVKLSDSNAQDFIMVFHFALRSIRSFVKLLIQEMESANWDIEAAASATQSEITFSKNDHKFFAFESFICREIFNGFNSPLFSIQHDQFLPNDSYQRRLFFFKLFDNLRSDCGNNFIKQNPDSPLGKFLEAKYSAVVHPKMEFSFFRNLDQRELVNSGKYPESEFFKAFAEMGRRVWMLHCLAFSFSQEVNMFQVNKNHRFSEVYMESVIDDIVMAADSDYVVAFTVVPGFKVGQMVVQSQVYLSLAAAEATACE